METSTEELKKLLSEDNKHRESLLNELNTIISDINGDKDKSQMSQLLTDKICIFEGIISEIAKTE